MKYLLDSSYFSNMLSYYPPDNSEFAFIWEKLKEKIRNGEILIIDKVFKELQRIQDNNFVREFLLEFRKLQNTNC